MANAKKDVTTKTAAVTDRDKQLTAAQQKSRKMAAALAAAQKASQEKAAVVKPAEAKQATALQAVAAISQKAADFRKAIESL